MGEYFYDVEDQRFRYASAIARCCGLRVTLEVARCMNLDDKPEKLCHVWRGSAEQFSRLWFAAPSGLKLCNINKMRYFTPGWLRGNLYREGPDAYRFVVEWGYGLTKIMVGRVRRQARADASFVRFMDRLMLPVELD